jgi:hypothetical protein
MMSKGGNFYTIIEAAERSIAGRRVEHPFGNNTQEPKQQAQRQGAKKHAKPFEGLIVKAKRKLSAFTLANMKAPHSGNRYCMNQRCAR